MSRKSSIVVVGSGPPLVLIPGIQGRWEWMQAAVGALSRRFRVVTFSLGGDPAGIGSTPALAFEREVERVEQALGRAGAARAVVCGVSYGGLVAVRFAATRPDRVALVLVSTPGPRWRPDERARRYAGSPLKSVPAFALGAVGRLWTEIAAARPERLDRWRVAAKYLGTIVLHPPSPRQMADRVRALDGHDFAADARAVEAPTLVLTGEADLDRVVPVGGTREYLSLIRASSGRTLERTGHIGLVTRSDEFADAIWSFAEARQ